MREMKAFAFNSNALSFGLQIVSIFSEIQRERV